MLQEKQTTSALLLETIFMHWALRLTIEWLQSIPVLDPDFENVDWPRKVYHKKIIGPNGKHFPVLNSTLKKQMTTNCNTDTKGQGFTFLEPKTWKRLTASPTWVENFWDTVQHFWTSFDSASVGLRPGKRLSTLCDVESIVPIQVKRKLCPSAFSQPSPWSHPKIGTNRMSSKNPEEKDDISARFQPKHRYNLMTPPKFWENMFPLFLNKKELEILSQIRPSWSSSQSPQIFIPKDSSPTSLPQ